MEAKKRVRVTGGASFLGSHLCSRLLAVGHEVLRVDNYLTGSREDIGPPLANPRFEAMRHDVTFPRCVKVDQIYNLACPARRYQPDPVATIKTSVHGAINVLGLAKRLKARVFGASTCQVYGDPTVRPQREDYRGNVKPIGPRACYDESKRCAEARFFGCHRQHGLEIRVAHIFNTYGPRTRADDGRMVSNVGALRGEPITLYGDGSQTRSFCYVDDMIDAFVRFMGTDTAIGPINLGNQHEIAVLELADRILKMTGSRSKQELRNHPQDDLVQRRPDITPGAEHSSVGA